MKYTGRTHSHSEPLEDYSEYKEKREAKITVKTAEAIGLIKNSSLKKEDKTKALIDMIALISNELQLKTTK